MKLKKYVIDFPFIFYRHFPVQFLLSLFKMHRLKSFVEYHNDLIFFEKSKSAFCSRRFVCISVYVQYSAWRYDWLTRSAVRLFVIFRGSLWHMKIGKIRKNCSYITQNVIKIPCDWIYILPKMVLFSTFVTRPWSYFG